MFRPLILLITVGIAGLSLGAAQPAQAQNWPSFDCSELLIDTNFDSLLDRSLQIDGEFRLFHNAGPTPQATDDPVNADELLSLDGKSPLLARSAPSSVGNVEKTLGCSLIIVEFSSSVDDTKLGIQDHQGIPVGFRLAIVLADLFKNSSAEEKSFGSWKDAKFAISTKLKSFNGDGITFLGGSNFDKVPYLTVNVWNDRSVRFVSTANAPQNVKDFLKESSAETPTELVVLCGTGDCTQIKNSLEPTPPVYALTDDQVQGGMFGPPSNEQSAGEQTSGVEAALAKVKPAVAPLPLMVNITAVNNAGEESTASLSEVGGLECLLFAVSKDLFETPPDCPSPEFSKFSDWNAKVRIADGRWQIIKGARFRDPTEIEVAPPEGQSIGGCSIDVAYTDKDGAEKLVQLEPKIDPLDPNSGTLFTAKLEYPPVRNGNDVTFTLLPQPDAASCSGGVERTVSVPAEETVKLTLLDEPPLSRAVVHTFVLNNQDLQFISLAQNDVITLGRSVLDAVESAHQRAAVTRSDTAWALTSADVGFLNETGSIESLVRLNATQLREQVINTFSAITETNGDSISSFSPAMAAERLKQALLPVVESARISGVDELTVTLIAPVTSRSDAGLNDPCTDPLYNMLPSDLSNDGGPSVQVAVFPLVRLRAGDTVVDLTKLRALSDGLYACRNTPVGLSIYPFFLEEWRPGVDVSSRYATALSDRLADLIDALVSDKQVSK